MEQVTGRGGADDSMVSQGLRIKGLIHPKNVNSACIRSVFKIQIGNLAGRLRTTRDRL